jgi:hypothetical protein
MSSATQKAQIEESNKTSPQSQSPEISVSISKRTRLQKGQWSKHYKESPGNGWNKRTVRLAQAWMERAARMEKSYFQRSTRAVIADRIFTVSYIVLGTIGGGMAFFNMGTDTEESKKSYSLKISIVIGCAAMLAAIFAGLNAFFKFGTHIENYKYAANKFSRLVRKIETVIHAANDDRPPAKEFLQDVSEKYYKYQDSGEHIIEETFNLQSMKIRLSETRRMCELPPLNEDDHLDVIEEDIDSEIISRSRLGLLKLGPQTPNVNKEVDQDCKDIEDIDFVGEL